MQDAAKDLCKKLVGLPIKHRGDITFTIMYQAAGDKVKWCRAELGHQVCYGYACSHMPQLTTIREHEASQRGWPPHILCFVSVLRVCVI